MNYNLNLKTLGPAIANTGYQNNMFDIGWDLPVNGEWMQPYHAPSNVSLEFRGGEWQQRTWSGHNVLQQNYVIEECVEAILNCDELFEKLKTWNKNAVKRLEKTVPRLKKEYEDAEARLKSLSSTDFKKISQQK